MAYKFQHGDARLSGSTTFEDALQGLQTLDVDGEATLASAIIEDLTSGRVPYVGAGSAIADSANFTWDNGASTLKSVHFSGSSNLSLGGNIVAGGFMTIDGVSTLKSDVTASAGMLISQELHVDGASTLASAAIEGALDVDGATTLDGLTVAEAAQFDVGVTIDGAIDANSTSNFQGDMQLQAALDVDGVATLASANVEGALDVDGATTLDGLSVAEVASFAADITASAGMLISEELHVDGVSTLASANIEGALDVDGATTLDGLTVAEAAVFSDAVQIDGAIDANSTSNFQGDMQLQAALDVDGVATLASANVEGALDVDGATTLDGLTVAEAAVFSSTLDVAGAMSGSGKLDLGGNLVVGGTADFNSTSDFQGAMNLQAGITVAGAADLNGNLDVDGQTDLDVLNVAEVASFAADITASAGVLISEELHVDGAATLASAKIEDLTSGRLVLAGTDGELEDNAAYSYLEMGGSYILAVSASGEAGYLLNNGVILASGGAEYFDVGSEEFIYGNNIGGVAMMHHEASATGKFEILISGSASRNFEVDFESDHVIFGSDMDVKFNKNLDEAFDIAADAIYFRDSDGYLKSRSWATIAGQIAGAGLTATNGQLSADAASAPNAVGDANATLEEGFNYGSATLTAARTWDLPAPGEAGDIVHVKAPLGCSATNYIKIVPDSDAGRIDGDLTEVRLESPYAAVSLICVDQASDLWRIY